MFSPRPALFVKTGASLAVVVGMATSFAPISGAQDVTGNANGDANNPAVSNPSSALDSIGTGSAGTGPDGTTEPNAGNGLNALLDLAGVGGPALDTGSEGSRDAGSGDLVDAGEIVGKALGSTEPLAAVGSDGGSATASVSAAGLIPGLGYSNPTGSVGSGTFTLGGSQTVPEYTIGIAVLNVVAVYIASLAERQERGMLSPQEVGFWHSVVVGSSQAGGSLEDAAAQADITLPEPVTGSIDSVRQAAADGPSAGGTDEDDAPLEETADATDHSEPEHEDHADAPQAVSNIGSPHAHYAVAAEEQTGHQLAVTGTQAVWSAAGASVLLVLGATLLAFARRRS